MLQQIDSAKYFIGKTLESPIMYDETRKIIYRTRSLLDVYNKDYLNALKNYILLHKLSDSIKFVDKSAEISRLKNWYEFEQKDNENLILHQEQTKQQSLLLILTVAIGMIFALFVLSLYFYIKISI
jgi:hypothetical protein